MELIRVGVDLAKNVFQVHGVDQSEKPAWQKRLTRQRWLEMVVKTVEPGCEIGMEACTGAHSLGASVASTRLPCEVDRTPVREAL